MKEVPSKSEWVGRILTCKTCLRSFEVQVGDKILEECYDGYRGYYVRYPKRFNLPCGHYYSIPPN